MNPKCMLPTIITHQTLAELSLYIVVEVVTKPLICVLKKPNILAVILTPKLRWSQWKIVALDFFQHREPKV